jgi:hypothetical protein
MREKLWKRSLRIYNYHMLLTPPVLVFATRRRWTWILAASGFIWLLAQFGLRSWIHSLVVRFTGLHIPLQETGAFNFFAWQIVWMTGLWIGARSADGELPFKQLPQFVYPLSTFICLFFVGVRHSWFGPRLTQQTLGVQLDKWQIGPLRMINLIAFTCVIYWLRKLGVRIVSIEPFPDTWKSIA